MNVVLLQNFSGMKHGNSLGQNSKNARKGMNKYKKNDAKGNKHSTSSSNSSRDFPSLESYNI